MIYHGITAGHEMAGTHSPGTGRLHQCGRKILQRQFPAAPGHLRHGFQRDRIDHNVDLRIFFQQKRQNLFQLAAAATDKGMGGRRQRFHGGRSFSVHRLHVGRTEFFLIFADQLHRVRFLLDGIHRSPCARRAASTDTEPVPAPIS